jgi:energy-coupling factor transport system substrate-specific component
LGSDMTEIVAVRKHSPITYKSMVPTFATIIVGAFILYLTFVEPSELKTYAALLTNGFMLLLLITFFGRFEETAVSSKEVALIGILGAIIAASRIPFAAIPNVQPCTFLIMAVGLVFGPLAGFMVGGTTAIVSNLFLGMGPWTIWQMAGWGMVGFVSGLIGKRSKDMSIVKMAILCFALGWMYNELLDFSSWVWLYNMDPAKFLAIFGAGLPFGLLHAGGNVVFTAAIGKPVMRAFRRFQSRFQVTYVDKVVQVPVGLTEEV